MTAMLPCSLMAPYRGLIFLRRHQALKPLDQNCTPLSQMMYLGRTSASRIVLPINVWIAAEVGLPGKTVKPMTRRE